MKSKKTLLVIDMQPEFTNPPCTDKIEAVCNLIKMAKKNKWDIVNLLYDVEELWYSSVSSTTRAYPQIEKLLRGYDKSETVIKSDCDGGREVVSHLQASKIASQDIIVCGCYADQCVLATLKHIRKLLPKVKITAMKNAIQKCYIFPGAEYTKIDVTVIDS